MIALEAYRQMSRRIVLCLLYAAFGLICFLPLQICAAKDADPITVRFDQLSPKQGLTLSITVAGDTDGVTTFSNEACCGIKDAQAFVRDVRIDASRRSLPLTLTASGWRVKHAPGETLTITYRLPPSGPLQIDAGTAGQFRPLIHNGLFHLIGTTALLLPTGRSGADPVKLDIDATRVVAGNRFVSSFGTGATINGIHSTRGQVASALYLGGPITLTLHDTAMGRLGIAHSGMKPAVRSNDLNDDALAIVQAARRFFNDGQPWYLISVHGAVRNGSKVNVGGGTGLTNSFAMFVADDLEFSDQEQREHFRWVLAHEYFHQWNGLTLRVATLPNSEKDDTSVYWFSEGVTEFHAMRLLTRAGLQSPQRSLAVLNSKLKRYGANSKRGISAREAGPLFWTDADGEQIPYLRGYLAAWYADLASGRSRGNNPGPDDLIRALVRRARAEPSFRVNNTFLAAYFSNGLAAQDAKVLHRFIIEGGEAPFAASSFGPCLKGEREQASGRSVLQFAFANQGNAKCFQH
jgi:predicted metalloprotease with PDZ domain